MATKQSFLKIFVIVVWVGSFATIMTDNFFKLNEFRSRIEDVSVLIDQRRGTRATANEDAGFRHLPALYRMTEKASRGLHPTKDPFAEVEELPDFKLTGTIDTDGRPSAVINDQMLSIGDMIKNFIIFKIGEDFVKLSDGEYTIELKLYLPPEPLPSLKELPTEETATEKPPLDAHPPLTPIRELRLNAYE